MSATIAYQCLECGAKEAWNDAREDDEGADPNWCPYCHYEGPRIRLVAAEQESPPTSDEGAGKIRDSLPMPELGQERVKELLIGAGIASEKARLLEELREFGEHPRFLVCAWAKLDPDERAALEGYFTALGTPAWVFEGLAQAVEYLNRKPYPGKP